MKAPQTDILTDVLHSVRLSSAVHCHAEASAPWGLRAEKAGAAFYIVTEGCFWLVLEQEIPIKLQPGDFVILPHATPHSLHDAPGSATVTLDEMLASRSYDADGIFRFGGGGDIIKVIGGCFYFEDQATNPLLRALPQLIHLKGAQGADMPWLEPTVQAIACEMQKGRPGAQTIITRYSDILFMQAVRASLASLSEQGGWLKAIVDPQIGPALGAIHHQPAAPWTVHSLAAHVAMSRSAFSARFCALVGEPPLHYISRWRMHQAATLLRAQKASVAAIAEQVGYESEAAFSKAFKRWVGQSPGAFRRTAWAG